MGIGCFTRDRRIITASFFILILAGIQQTVGWIFINGQYLYKNKDCTYYLSGYYVCSNPDSIYQSQNYLCFNCRKATTIHYLFYFAILYSLVYSLSTVIFVCCLMLYSERKYNAMKCSQIFLIICYSACMVLHFLAAKQFDDISDLTLNLKVRDACLGLGILCIIQLLIQFGLYYDVHQYISDKINDVQLPETVIQQHRIYQGIYALRSQEDHYRSQNNNIETVRQNINNYQPKQQNDTPLYDQIISAQHQLQHIPQQPVDGLPILGQPVNILPKNQLPVFVEIEVGNENPLPAIDGLAIKD
ncbi:hypothetical protein pb186bvf_007877 [Paramecium bursaria]